MIAGFDHTGVYVADIRRSVEFYKRYLQGEVVREVNLPEKQLTILYLQIGQGVIELIEKKSTEYQGFHHIAFKTQEIGLEWDRLSCQEGVDLVVPPKRAVSGLGEVAFFLDPDGTRVELIDQPEFRRPSPAQNAQSERMDVAYVALSIAHISSSVYLYTKILDAQPIRPEAYSGINSRAQFLRCGNGVIRLSEISDICDQGRPGIDHVALWVKDIGLQAEKLRRSSDIAIFPDSIKKIEEMGGLAAFGPDNTKFVFYERLV